MTSLRAFGKWWELEPVLPNYKLPTPGRPIPHPLPEGIDGVYRMCEAAANMEARALVALCGLAGLRVGEALSIRPEHFDLTEMMLTVRGKGDKTRTIPISDECWTNVAAAYVSAAASQRTLITYSERAARKLLTRLGKQLGFRRQISSHDLRATLATAAYDKTHDLRVVQEVLGHASSTTTEVYTGVTTRAMREAVAL
jgi:integrase/recombinase XerD